jgi:hypothetical protein
VKREKNGRWRQNREKPFVAFRDARVGAIVVLEKFVLIFLLDEMHFEGILMVSKRLKANSEKEDYPAFLR